MAATSPALPAPPCVDVVIPVLNEAETITAKLENLARLAYPRSRLTFTLVDGGSADETPDIARHWARRAGLPVNVIVMASSGKPAQLSAGFARSRSPWVLVTDADARLAPDTLETMVGAALADPRVALVGTPVRPRRAHRLDEMHWAFMNWLRQVECRMGSAGIAVGPAYLARRDLLAPFPEHTIMDDVHLSCRAAMAGGLVAVVPADVTELRAPFRTAELLRHKYRKTLGYLTEVLYFLPRVGQMRGPARWVFIWRAALFAGLPLADGALLGSLLHALPVVWVACGMAALAGVLLLTGSANRLVSSFAAAAVLPLVWSALLASAWLSYPFVRQTARYLKVSLTSDDC